MTIKHMLDGYKVLDFTQFVAGPTVTKLMAEMGAEIVKVELAPNGDLCRNFPYVRDRRSAYFVQQNRGKMSLCVDVKRPAGNAIIHALVPHMDVLVQNYAPGVIGRMGLSYEKVRELNPKIIMCSVSTFGQTGPLSPEPGYDFIGQAYAGVTSLSGEEGGGYYPPALAIGDVSTGVHAYAAVATALLHRERTGEGQHLDITLLDSYFHYQDLAVELVSSSHGAARVQRMGAQIGALCPAGLFNTLNGALWIFAFQDNHWAKLCEVMGRADLAADPNNGDNARRVANRPAINGAIDQWLGRLSGRDAAIAILREAHIPNAPVLTVEEAMQHPHLLERQTVRTVHDRILGDFQVPGFPLRFSGFPATLELAAPFLGEHNRTVLTRYLGYSEERIANLEREQILNSAAY